LLPLRHDLSFEDGVAYLIEKRESANSTKVDVAPLKRLLCGAGKSVCSISPEGEVSPCLLMPIKLGNLREETMADIWHQKGHGPLDKLRTPMSYDSSLCLNCNLLPFCARCPGVAYLETGDPFSPAPSACRYAKWRASQKTENREVIYHEKGFEEENEGIVSKTRD
jgi:radical SAM protein with 4Fe4S-binding SPASM domain